MTIDPISSSELLQSVESDLLETAEQLRQLKSALGSGYWQNECVLTLQNNLRQYLGRYSAWAENRLPLHQRARQAARFESECAALLWPGRASDD